MKDWMIWGLVGFAGYWIYENYIGSAMGVVGATGYSPIPNARGDQFSCPVGTEFTEIESMVSGSGVCQ